MSAPTLNGAVGESPSTPPDARTSGQSLSQQSLPSTEGPNSPAADPVSSLKTELNEDHPPSSQVIPSSLTPPPSSQVPQTSAGAGAGLPLGYITSHRANMFSPPTTTLNALRRDDGTAAGYTPPTAEQISEASIEELRTLFQACLTENAKLKMETAHHKLQYNLLSMQADEDAKRAAVEHEMIRREVDVLRMAEHSRQTRRELNAAADSAQAKYLQLKVCYEATLEDNDKLKKRVKSAKKVIQQKEDEIANLVDERDMLLRRIRENREHFHMLCSPGGAFHGALTPKNTAMTSPQQHRTPRQTPRSIHHRDLHHEANKATGQAGFEALLQAVYHDNNSAPSTPVAANRPASRIPARHTRGVQSMSSLPSTPQRGAPGALLPSVDLVPQTEPPRLGVGNRFMPESPSRSRRKSRESTISADDNEELARAAVEAATHSFMSHVSRDSGLQSRSQRQEEEEVYESHASQAASEMLRRDPRESFEVASSVGSRDGTPGPAEKSAKLQARLFAGVNKAGIEKRKIAGGADMDDSRPDVFTSPTKRARYAPEHDRRVGLGIRYDH